MTNRNYHAGRAKEYRTMRCLEQSGYETYRTAGSHGTFDVIARAKGDVRFIQVKSGNASLTPIDREQLQQAAKDGQGVYAVECWTWRPRARHAEIVRF